MQITNPRPGMQHLWDWRENVDKGKAILLEKLDAARRHVREQRHAASMYLADTNRFRKSRGLSELHHIHVPDLTEEWLVEDAVRGYNGWAGGLHEFRLRQTPVSRWPSLAQAAVDTMRIEEGQVPAGARFAMQMQELEARMRRLGASVDDALVLDPRPAPYSFEMVAYALATENERPEGAGLVADAVWERVPVRERPTRFGEPDYVEKVRGTAVPGEGQEPSVS
jgi:hypothetical protein